MKFAHTMQIIRLRNLFMYVQQPYQPSHPPDCYYSHYSTGGLGEAARAQELQAYSWIALLKRAGLFKNAGDEQYNR